MKLVKNAAGRLVPNYVNGKKQIPFKGVNKKDITFSEKKYSAIATKLQTSNFKLI